MATSGAGQRQPPLHWVQRTLDSITFMVLLGVFFPTGLYTLWSIIELRDLPHFGESPHGALHGTIPRAAATASGGAPAAAIQGATAVMRSMAFSPRLLEVSAGTTVTWVNEDPFDHAVAYGTPATPAAERLFEASGDFGQGGTFSHVFDTPGSHDVYCSTIGHYAAGMVMTVVVTEAAR
jgi:plastocyanin